MNINLTQKYIKHTHWIFSPVFILIYVIFSCAQALPFYQLTKDNQTLYLVGTMHLGKANDQLSEKLQEAIRHSDEIILELDSQQAQKTAALIETLRCNTPCLQQDLKESLIHELSKLSGIDISKMSAPLAYITLTIDSFTRLGFEPRFGTETLIMQYADLHKIPVSGLETAEEQVKLIKETPLKLIIADLKLLVTEPDFIQAEINTFYNTWKEGDVESLYEVTHDEEVLKKRYHGYDDNVITVYQNYIQAILPKRNHRFIDRLLPKITAQSTKMIAVGALHLGGEEGLIRLFKNEGYTIKSLE